MLDNLQDLFTNQHGLFFKTLQFESLFIIVFVVIFFTYYFNKTYGFVIILLAFAFFIANSYVGIKTNTLNDFNHITLVKLQKLQNTANMAVNNKLKIINVSNPNTLTQTEKKKLYENSQLDFLYIDANMIHFLESIIPIAKYNELEFYSLLKGTNNILKIKSQIDTYYESNKRYPTNTSELFETANQLKTNTINNLHNFIYTIPKSQTMRNYLHDATERYSVLINRVTDSIHQSYKNNIKQNGINASTHFVSYNQTKPFDTISNHSILPGSSDHTLQQFYI